MRRPGRGLVGDFSDEDNWIKPIDIWIVLTVEHVSVTFGSSTNNHFMIIVEIDNGLEISDVVTDSKLSTISGSLGTRNAQILNITDGEIHNSASSETGEIESRESHGFLNYVHVPPKTKKRKILYELVYLQLNSYPRSTDPVANGPYMYDLNSTRSL